MLVFGTNIQRESCTDSILGITLVVGPEDQQRLRVEYHYLCMMEEWQLEFEWLRVRHWVKDRFGKKELPDLNAVLFVIGMQEVGKALPKYTKEEKQDLMHVAICHLLEEEGYFQFEGFDADG